MQKKVRLGLEQVMISTKEDSSTSDEQVEVLSTEYKITTELLCDNLFIIFLSTMVDLGFEVHKLVTFSSNTGKVHFEGLLDLLKYIWDANNLGLKYYAKI